MDDTLTDRIRHDAECLAIDCLYAEKTHLVYATALRRTALWGGSIAAILAAEAGLSGVGDFLPGTAIGILALISTVITTFVTAAKPGELSEQHHARGVDFNILRLKLRRFIHIEMAMPSLANENAVARLAELSALKAELSKQQPPTPTGVWLRMAKKSVAKGEETYERDRAIVAVGSGNYPLRLFVAAYRARHAQAGTRRRCRLSDFDAGAVLRRPGRCRQRHLAAHRYALSRRFTGRVIAVE